MVIDALLLTRFRCHYETRLAINGAPRVLISGPNGAGKTSILEAIHLLACGAGIRTRRDSDFARFTTSAGENTENHDTVGWRVAAHLFHGPTLALKWTNVDGRAATLDDTPQGRGGGLIGRLRMTLLKPEDIQVVEGGPEIRRRFLDVCLCQANPSYLAALRRYRRAHQQAHRASPRRGFSGNTSVSRSFLTEQCAVLPAICRARADACEKLAAEANRLLMKLGLPGHIGVEYRPAAPASAAVALANGDWETVADVCLEESTKLASVGQFNIFQASLFGPARDDVRLTLDGVRLKAFGSQGQKRLVALLLRLAEASVLSAAPSTGTSDRRAWDPAGVASPALILVDDVIGELDKERFAAFIELLDDVPHQIWIAATDTKIYEERWPKWVRYDIKGGALQGVNTR